MRVYLLKIDSEAESARVGARREERTGRQPVIGASETGEKGNNTAVPNAMLPGTNHMYT